MFIVKDRRAIVLNTETPDMITELIPSARHFVLKGKSLVAVPHRIDEVKVLRNIGLDAPSPIGYYYEWPGGKSPFMAQRETAMFLTLHNRAFVLNSLGTGKTLATLWAYHYLKQRGLVNKMLVISPLSTLERTWADEVFRSFPDLSYNVLYGSAARRKKLLAVDSDVYIINHDGLSVIKDLLASRPDIDLVVVDEIAQCARNVQTARWKTLNAVINGQKIFRRAWGLTGTPTPNEPTDAYGQVKLLCPEKVPPYFNRFKDMTMKQMGPFRWVPRPVALEIVREVMQPAIRFTRDECIDLPPCMYENRAIEMTDDQKAAYKHMAAKLILQQDEAEVRAVNEAVKISKLVQIACGVVYDKEGVELYVGAENRLNEVTDIIEQSDAKVIVFVPFRSAVSLVVDHIQKNGYRCGVIHGGVTKNERDDTFRDFQNPNTDMKVLVAQPAAMSHGLTLTTANTIVWYAPVTSNEVFEQANGRITRPGQKNNQFIIMLEGSPVERRIYEKLKNKQSLQGTLLDLIQSDTC